MELEATVPAVGFDEVECPGRVEDGGLQNVKFGADTDVNLFRDLFTKCVHARFRGGEVDDDFVKFLQLLGEFEDEHGVGRFVGYEGVVAPVLCYHFAGKSVNPNLVVEMVCWGPVAFLCDLRVVGVDKLHTHLAKRASCPELLLVEVAEHQHFLAFVDEVLNVSEVLVSVDFELGVPVE